MRSRPLSGEGEQFGSENGGLGNQWWVAGGEILGCGTLVESRNSPARLPEQFHGGVVLEQRFEQALATTFIETVPERRILALGAALEKIGSLQQKKLARFRSVQPVLPERALQLMNLLRLVERLSTRISQIDDLGMLDASVLGEMVHPRTFNAIRRLRDGETSVLDEEEERAELAGPELLLKQLREMLNRAGSQAVLDLPDGIHSGLRRGRHNGIFFHFRANRPDGTHRHFWRFVDAATGKTSDNRFEIARMIACGPEEPRYIGDQEAFALQGKAIDDIVSGEQALRTRRVVVTGSDPVQQAIAEDLKSALRRGAVERERVKAVLPFLGQGVGRAVILKLRDARRGWEQTRDDGRLLRDVEGLLLEYSKEMRECQSEIGRHDLQLVCFDHVSAAG